MNPEAPDPTATAPIIWTPTDADRENSRVSDFMAWLGRELGLEFSDYESLRRWSIDDVSGFWAAIWNYFGVSASQPYQSVLSAETMLGQRWFTPARLSYAEHVLRAGKADDVAIVAIDEDRPPAEMTWGDLRGQVGALATALRDLGVQPGDRVAGYLPNIAAAVVSMLATACIGATWTSCSPDFGIRSVLDRLGRVEPTVLIAVDGYRFNGRDFDRRDVVLELTKALPTLTRTVLVRSLRPDEPAPGALDALLYDELVAEAQDFAPVHVDFSHPLWILFSSGTTGPPKGIVHSHGGILLEHFKALGLCLDIGPDDRYFFHSSTSWMAWNFLVGGLLHGATIVLYSGSPTYGGADALWRIAADVRASVLGMGSAYANACGKAGVRLSGVIDLSALRTVIPTGSPLPLGGWKWLHAELDERVRIDGLCGGTDVCTVFFGGSPILPVRLGEISCRWLGVDAHAYDENGQPVIGTVGEFVIGKPMPSMPIYFWNDPGASQFRHSYLDTYPGVWRQGDWIVITEEGGVMVLGRSDATLNRGGVRLGSAEIYTVIEGEPEILDSLVVGVEMPDGEYYMPLFVVPVPGFSVDDALRDRVTRAIRAELSPRHVPDEIIEMTGLPHTLTGKKLEIPVKRILQGHAADHTVAMGSIDRPELLAWFEAFAASRR